MGSSHAANPAWKPRLLLPRSSRKAGPWIQLGAASREVNPHDTRPAERSPGVMTQSARRPPHSTRCLDGTPRVHRQPSTPALARGHMFPGPLAARTQLSLATCPRSLGRHAGDIAGRPQLLRPGQIDTTSPGVSTSRSARRRTRRRCSRAARPHSTSRRNPGGAPPSWPPPLLEDEDDRLPPDVGSWPIATLGRGGGASGRRGRAAGAAANGNPNVGSSTSRGREPIVTRDGRGTSDKSPRRRARRMISF